MPTYIAKDECAEEIAATLILRVSDRDELAQIAKLLLAYVNTKPQRRRRARPRTTMEQESAQ